MINSKIIVRVFKSILPSPFSIAIILTLTTFLMALFLTIPEDKTVLNYSGELAKGWKDGLWDKSSGGIYFAFQMMLMLVLGHVLALTSPVKRLIEKLLKHCTSTTKSALILSFFSMFMGLLNWGLGLVFGAILARKIGERFSENNKVLNYGLIGACAYLSMITWHGGLSGSAPTKVMESGYLKEVLTESDTIILNQIPETVPFETTIGGSMNLFLIIVLLILLPLTAYAIGRNKSLESVPEIKVKSLDKIKKNEKIKGGYNGNENNKNG